MLASHDLEFIYVGPPKNATLSTRRWLTVYFPMKSVGAYHQAKRPERCKDYFGFISVRNPYPRLWSWYQWEKYQIRVDRKGRGKQFEQCTQTFEAFLRYLISRRGEIPFDPLNPQECLTQYDYWVLSQCDHFIKVEQLVSDLKTLPFIKKPEHCERINHIRETPGKEPMKITSNEEKLIGAYCPEDFDLFNYERRG